MGFGLGKLAFTSLRSLPKVQVPFDQLDATLTQLQAQQDITESLLGKMPNYLSSVPAHQAMAERIKSYQQKLGEQLAAIAEKGNVDEYLQSLAGVTKNIAQMYQPGGVAYNLEQDYNAYLNAQKAIEEHVKDFTDPAYRTYFMAQLNSQLQNIKEEDLLRGPSGISTPNLFGEINITEELDNFLKDTLPDIHTEIRQAIDPRTGRLNPYMLEKIKEEGYDPARIEQMIDSFLEQPRIQRALEVQAFSEIYNTGDETKQYYVQRAADLIDAEFTRQIAQLTEQKEAFNKARNKKTRDAQLRALGFNSITDFNEYIDSQISALEQNKQRTISSLDPLSAAKLIVQENYKNTIFPKYQPRRTEIDIIWDKYRLATLRYSMQKKLIDYQINALYTNDTTAINIRSTLVDPKDLYSNVQQSETALRQTIASFQNREEFSAVHDIVTEYAKKGRDAPDIGVYIEGINKIMEAFDNSVINGKIDENRLREEIDRNLGPGYYDKLTSSLGTSSPDALYTTVSNMHDIIDVPYKAYSTFSHQYNMLYSSVRNNLDSPEVEDNLNSFLENKKDLYRTLSQKGKELPEDKKYLQRLYNIDNIDELKQEMKNNPEVMNDFFDYLKMVNPKVIEDFSIPKSTVVIENEGINAELDSIKSTLGDALKQAIDPVAFRNATGMKWDDIQGAKVEDIRVGYNLVNGENIPVFYVRFKVGKDQYVSYPVEVGRNSDLSHIFMSEMAGLFHDQVEVVPDSQGGQEVRFKDPTAAIPLINLAADNVIAPSNNISVLSVRNSIKALRLRAEQEGNRFVDTIVSNYNVYDINSRRPIEYITKAVRSPDGRYYLVSGPIQYVGGLDVSRIQDEQYRMSYAGGMLDIMQISNPEDYSSIAADVNQYKAKVFEGYSMQYYNAQRRNVLMRGRPKQQPLGPAIGPFVFPTFE